MFDDPRHAPAPVAAQSLGNVDPKWLEILLDSLDGRGTQLHPVRLLSLNTADWEGLLALASRLRVQTLLAACLGASRYRDLLPQEIRERLLSRYRSNLMRNTLLHGEMCDLAAALQAEGIPVMALKGMCLAQTVYRDIALRLIGDIDIMVPLSQAGRAYACAREMGYRPGLSREFEPDVDRLLAVGQHLTRLSKPLASDLEIHANITKPQRLPVREIAGLWQRSVPFRVGEATLRGLCPEDLLLNVCEHSSYGHCFEFGLQPLCDIAWIVECYAKTFCWESFCERANGWGWATGIALTLRVAQRLLAARVPERVFEKLRAAPMADDMLQVAMSQVLAEKPRGILITDNMLRLYSEPSRRGKLCVFLDSVKLTPELMAAMYPVRPGSRKMYWYYLVRARSILWRHARSYWRLRSGGRQTDGMMRRKKILRDFLQIP